MKFRKKPVVIEAIQWIGEEKDVPLIQALGSRGVAYHHASRELYIETLEGTMRANVGDWIIKGVKNEIYPCKPDIFEMTYEPVEF